MSHLISVAPMMDWTDRHDRYFLRLIAPDVRLYTEMITAHAILRGDTKRLLDFHPVEHPLALQLGGNVPDLLAKSAKIGEEMGYDEINLNVGCPSSRVSSGRFGACLMLEPDLVADCIHAMQSKIKIPVSVKCRIGVDQEDTYENLHHFITKISEASCKIFIIHARKAWLTGLSPKENREIPPLRYEIVQKIKQDFPHLNIILNGGLKNIIDVDKAFGFQIDGVMIGREAYRNPYFLAELQNKYFPRKTNLTRHEIIERFLPYIRDELKNKTKLISITRHILGLFHGIKGASEWRRYLSTHASCQNANIEVIEKALALVSLT